jgi:hypothetical protein
LWSIGEKITDKEVIKKILHSVPNYLEQVAISIETLLHLNSMFVEVAIWASPCYLGEKEEAL